MVRVMLGHRVLLAVALILLITPLLASAQEGVNPVQAAVRKSLREYNYTRVLELAERIASLGPRAPGYPGYERALRLIVNEVEALNLTYTVQNFTIIAPVETESYVEVLEPHHLVLRAYSLWPHGGIAAGAGVKEAPLVYVGKGGLEEFDGKPVNGSIVVMEYDGSGGNWLNALRFGAKAVIFLGGGNPQREALGKFDPITPVPFVRLYLEPKEAAALKELLRRGSARARVRTDMELRDVTGHNVLVEIPGTEKEDEIIAFVAHFDAWCVAPGLANSTEEAISAAALLELMRYLALNRPPRTAWFLFTSGHWNGLTGPRYFIENFILRRPDLIRGERTIWYIMGLDISADIPVASLIYVGHFYQTSGRTFITTKFYWLQGMVNTYAGLVGEYLNETGLPRSAALQNAIRMLGAVRPIDLTHGPEWMWSSTMSKPYVLDTEPFVIAGMAAFTLRTSYSYRPFEGEPVSDLPYVRSNFEDRVVPQLASAVMIASALLNEPTIGVMKSLILPTRRHPLLYWGFLQLQVQVLQYNITKGWYDPAPYAIVRVSRWSSYPFAWMLTRADHNGTALIYGVTPQGLNAWYVEAWKIANETWMIAPAWGMRSGGPTWINLLVERGYTSTYVMPMNVRVLVDLYNPTLMRRTLDDPRYASSNVWAGGGAWPTVFETSTGITPLYTFVSSNERSGMYLVFASYVQNVTVTLSIGARWPTGIAIEAEKTLWALDYAVGTYTIAAQRYSVLSEREVRRLSADLMIGYAEHYLSRAVNALRNNTWSAAFRNSLAAWSFASRTYSSEVMPLYEECIRSAVTLVPFIIVTGYFLERLLTKGEGLRMIFNVLAFQIALFVIYAFTHPAFWVVPSTLLAALAIGMLILMTIVLWIFYREASDIVSRVAAQLLGYHEVVTERTAAMLMAVSLSTENMRKRPLRSILTLIPIAVFAMALVSLASVSPYTAVLPKPMELVTANFYGFTVKRAYAVLGDMLDVPTIEMLRAIVGEKGLVSPRVVYYSPSVINLGPYALALSHNVSIPVPAALGLTPEAASLLLRNAMVRGLPKPFFSEEQPAIVLPVSMANQLGVDVGDEIELYGMKFVVTGIFSETAMDALKDPDGRRLAPVDSIYYAQLHGFAVPLGGAIVPQPYAWSRVVIIPSGVAMKLGGRVSVVDILLNPDVGEEEFEKIAHEIAYAVDALCYGQRKDGSVIAYSRFPTYMALGWEMMVVPFAITSLSIVVSLLGSIKERTRDLFTYSSVGLSPSGAMLMFITEFAVYGFMGATLGYFAGWALSKVMRAVGVLPVTFVFNYASVAISLVLFLVLLSTLAAAAYPSYLASRIITPSLERKWKVPRTPRGSLWDIPLPFRVPTEREAQAVLLYLQEYYLGAGYEKRLFKVSSDPKVDIKEKKLVVNIRLYPYDAGTEQEVNLYFVKERVGGWRAAVSLRLLKGLGNVWTGPSQYGYLDDLRKQMLLWGTLPSSERAKYIRRVYELLAESGEVMKPDRAIGEREPKS
ncbi:MAG: FtsX-like permease family protein [Thermofilaceae archaeon]